MSGEQGKEKENPSQLKLGLLQDEEFPEYAPNKESESKSKARLGGNEPTTTINGLAHVSEQVQSPADSSETSARDTDVTATKAPMPNIEDKGATTTNGSAGQFTMSQKEEPKTGDEIEIQSVLEESATPVPTITVNTPSVTPPSEPTEQTAKPLKLSRKHISKGTVYFIKKTLDAVLLSKEGKRKGPLRDTSIKVLELVSSPPADGVDPNIIFEPMRLACETQSTQSMTAALDCLGKLIAMSFFDIPPPPVAMHGQDVNGENLVPAQRADAPTKPLMERVVDVVCDCFQGEATDDKVQLQIIKALLSAVLDENEGSMVHQSPLLKAIRQTYNIFLLSKNATTQNIAQGTLEQMVNAVFSRIKASSLTKDDLSTDNLSIGESSTIYQEASREKEPVNGDPSATEEDSNSNMGQPEEKVTLDSFAKRQSFDRIPDNNDTELVLTREETFVKDGFLIFRSMCKLSIKAFTTEGNDVRSQMVRSKLLSLHMISAILTNHMKVFTSSKSIIRSSANRNGVQFMQAIKQYLCHALSRNAVSHIPQVFEVSCGIFWRMLDNMRDLLKKEIEVFLNEIYLPILEMKTSSYQQKMCFINVLSRLCSNPRALVEVYLNYDCDRTAMDNLYERYSISVLLLKLLIL